MTKVTLVGSLTCLHYKGVEFTTRMVSPPLELTNDSYYILPVKDAKKLQNNNLGQIVDIQEVLLPDDIESDPPANTNPSILHMLTPLNKQTLESGSTLGDFDDDDDDIGDDDTGDDDIDDDFDDLGGLFSSDDNTSIFE